MHQSGVQTFGGPSRQLQQQRCYFYGGPQQQKRVFEPTQIPTFESITHNRIMKERRFFLNNSNTKYLAIGIIPASKILSGDAPGFHIEAFICGEKCSPLPLGGIKGQGDQQGFRVQHNSSNSRIFKSTTIYFRNSTRGKYFDFNCKFC